MELAKERLSELLNECIGYIYELKSNECAEENNYFWNEVIGMTEEEMNYYGLVFKG